MNTPTLYSISAHVWQLAMNPQEDECSVSNGYNDAGNARASPQRREVALFPTEAARSSATGKEDVHVISGHVFARQRRFNPLIGQVALDGTQTYTIEAPTPNSDASHGTLLNNGVRAWFFKYTGCRPHVDYVTCTDLLAADTAQRFENGRGFELVVDTLSPKQRVAAFID